MITHFVWFQDEAEAIAALPGYWEAGDWRREVVDGPIPVTDGMGATMPGCFLNIGLEELDTSLPGLTGAGTPLIYGTTPKTPQRVFA